MVTKIDDALLVAGIGLIVIGVVLGAWWLILLGGITVFINVLTRVIIGDRCK